MLADDFMQRSRRNLRRVREGDGQFAEMTKEEVRLNARASEGMIDHFEVAQRFVLSPQVTEAAADLAKSNAAIEHSRDYLFTPAKFTWLEWSGQGAGWGGSNRHGVFLRGGADGSAGLVTGAAMYVYDEDATRSHQDSLPMFYDFPGDGPLFRSAMTDPLAEAISARWRLRPRPGDYQTDTRRLGRFIAAVLALINTPRVSVITGRDDHKLNASRLKKGRPPLLSFSEVTIRPDSGWIAKSELRAVGTGMIPRHHVRTFLRLKRGRVELVTAHWRGNPERGYKLHRHVIRMDGEEAGAWKGEPLEGPRIIQPGEDLSRLEA